MAALLFSLPGQIVAQTSGSQTAKNDSLEPYVSCAAGGTFVVVEVAERKEPFFRDVKTAEANSEVRVLHGISLHIAYAGTPFVNFKLERLGSYNEAKRILIAGMEYVARADAPRLERDKPQQSSYNGFDLYSIDAKQLSGGVLTMYLLFRDADQTVTTLYVLNTPPEDPKFSTIAEYRSLRDEYLLTYSSCADAKLKAPAPETTPKKADLR